MSKPITVFCNTLSISRECAIEAYKQSWLFGNLDWYSHFDVLKHGHVKFENRNREVFDWIGNHPRLRDILLKHEAEGRVGFAAISVHGQLQLWGWDFDGQGGVVPLKGTVHLEQSTDAAEQTA